MSQISFSEPEPRLGGKLRMLPWFFILMVIAAGLAGGGALYSAANGSFMPWAKPHLIRFGISVAPSVVCRARLARKRPIWPGFHPHFAVLPPSRSLSRSHFAFFTPSRSFSPSHFAVFDTMILGGNKIKLRAA